MNTYSLLLNVEGDRISGSHKIATELFADNLADLARKTYPSFREELNFIWKDMESAILMEARPSPLLTIECECNGEPIDTEELYEAYFSIRKRKWLDSVRNFKNRF